MLKRAALADTDTVAMDMADTAMRMVAMATAVTAMDMGTMDTMGTTEPRTTLVRSR